MSTFFKHVIKDGPLKNLFDGNHPLILAVQYFGALTVIEWQKLGGPCARCHRYYIKRRHPKNLLLKAMRKCRYRHSTYRKAARA